MPDWPKMMGPARVTQPHLNEKVIPTDLGQELHDAARNAMERASLGHNDGWQRLKDAIDRYEREVGE